MRMVKRGWKETKDEGDDECKSFGIPLRKRKKRIK